MNPNQFTGDLRAEDIRHSNNGIGDRSAKRGWAPP
jgi:hypothetical protein